MSAFLRISSALLILSLVVVFSARLPAGSISKKTGRPTTYDLREGDIVFQSNRGPQAIAVRDATDSEFTHCGVVTKVDDRWGVLEAAQPVRITPLRSFIERSVPGTFHARRLENPLDAEALAEAGEWAARQTGKDYDIHFQWSDTKQYCSELVWKFFKEAGVELCEPRPFKDYNLDPPSVRDLIQRRYGGMENLPLEELAVAPGDLAASKLLIEVPRIAPEKN